MEKELHDAFVAGVRTGCPSPYLSDAEIESYWEQYRKNKNWPRREEPKPFYPDCTNCGQPRHVHFGRAEYCTNDGFETCAGPVYTAPTEVLST